MFKKKVLISEKEMATTIDCLCNLVIMQSCHYCTSGIVARRFLVRISRGQRLFCVHDLPVSRWVLFGFSGFLPVQRHAFWGAIWWLQIDLWRACECEWLSVSIFSPCDELTTCPGHSAPLAPSQMGEAPAPQKTPLRNKAIDDGRMEAALPNLIPWSSTTWKPLSDISIISSLLTSVSK